MLHFNYDEKNVSDIAQRLTDISLRVSNTIPLIFVGTKIVLNRSSEKNRTRYAHYTFSVNLAVYETDENCYAINIFPNSFVISNRVNA